MPRGRWSPKRERQYQHIKSGLLERGVPRDVAEEIAARTVNKERARAGEAREASRTSLADISSGRRGGLRSHRGRAGAPTRSSTTKPGRAASAGARP
jgi:plasmid stabilization system protein ParE